MINRMGKCVKVKVAKGRLARPLGHTHRHGLADYSVGAFVNPGVGAGVAVGIFPSPTLVMKEAIT